MNHRNRLASKNDQQSEYLSGELSSNMSVFPLRIAHIITGLEPGGAEMVLFRLLAHQDRITFPSHVISLTGLGTLGPKISDLGVPVLALGMRRGILNPLSVIRLIRLLRRVRPDIVQTWMYHANLVGGVAARLAQIPPIVWGIHHTNLEPGQDKRTTILTMKASVLLSNLVPAFIVCCSEASRSVHQRLGYPNDRMLVIPNGYDLSDFKPNPEARSSVRHELGIPSDATIIGMAARFHPQKDHKTFIEAAGFLHTSRPETHFLMCGSGIDVNNDRLRSWVEEVGIADRVHLLGSRNDMPRIFAALDIFSTSSSHGEAFPNVIGEAMASGVPCVVTDVGDSALIVGETGIVVPPRDPQALADGMFKLLEIGKQGRERLGRDARQRVEMNFSVATMVAKYGKVYRELSNTKRRTNRGIIYFD